MVAVFPAMAACRFDDVIAGGRTALLFRPPGASVHTMIGQALWQQRKYNEAVAELKLASGDDAEGWRIFEGTNRRLGPDPALKAHASRVAAAKVKRSAATGPYGAHTVIAPGTIS